MTENNESSDRLVRVASPKENRLDRLMEEQIINTADLTQQIKEISVQIKAQATFHDRTDKIALKINIYTTK